MKRGAPFGHSKGDEGMRLPIVLLSGAALLFAGQALAEWTYSEQPDTMRGAITKIASVPSNNEASFSFPYQGGSRMSLALRNSARFGTNVILMIAPGQFVCMMECSVHVKFDAGKVETFGASGPADGSAKAVFIDSYDRFLGKLKKARKMTVEADFYQEGAPQFEFDVAGLVWR